MTRAEYADAYDNGYKLTVRFLVSRGLTGENAEEAAQAAWAKGWEHLSNLRNPKMVVSWVNTIALNLFRNWFRRRESIELVPEIPTAPGVSAQSIDIHRTLDRCEPKDRELLERHYLEGYTSEELAKETGCTPVAVRVRLLRVRRRLGAVLRPRRNGLSHIPDPLHAGSRAEARARARTPERTVI
jgi:RNA polymerase sigma factor (sigma-70 family)